MGCIQKSLENRNTTMTTQNSLVNVTQLEKRIAEKVDSDVTSHLAVSNRIGGVGFANMEEVMNFAKLMAISQIGIRKHLRGNVGACLAVCIQSLEWGMSPFAVANKSYNVNDQLSYEAQLVHAVILRRAPIKGRPKVEWKTEGGKKICRVWCELRDEPGEIVDYESPEFDKIQPKNSPLWKNDPDQQQWYFSVRAWCRRHFPDVLLGVYTPDELPDEPLPPQVQPTITRSSSLDSRLDALAGQHSIEDLVDSTLDTSEAVQVVNATAEHEGQPGGVADKNDDGLDIPPGLRR
jgi:RecT family protein